MLLNVCHCFPLLLYSNTCFVFCWSQKVEVFPLNVMSKHVDVCAAILIKSKFGDLFNIVEVFELIKQKAND